MGFYRGPQIIRDGLVLYLDAANIKSYPTTGTTWTDITGNGNNATLINGPTFNSDNVGSIVFDGVNDRGTFTSPITSTSSQTYEVWVKGVPSNTATDGFGYILHNNSLNTSIGGAYMGIGYAGSTLQTNEIFAFFNGAWTNMGTGVIGNSTTVRQIVLTWNGVIQTAYVDGISRVSQSLTTTPSNFSTTTSFGDFKDATFRQIIGNIYMIKIYNRALTLSEIQQNYNANKGRFNL